MMRSWNMLGAALLTWCAATGPVAAAQAEIENELVLITPVARTLTDPALAEVPKERWNVDVKTSALAAGTPVAYGRIVEWKGRPDADIFIARSHGQAAALGVILIAICAASLCAVNRVAGARVGGLFG